MASHKIKIGFLAILGLAVFFYWQAPRSSHIEWGVSFSPRQATYLGLDWKMAYQEVLRDLKPKHLRIMAYWDTTEPTRGQYSFTELDFLLSAAEKNQTKVIVVVGRKQPRWPECHDPEWVKTLDSKSQNAELLQYIEQTVLHYKDNKAIESWQVENEPFFPYGLDCPTVSKDLFRQEIELTKRLDSRPVVVTDSGEKGAWLPTARAGGDIFGATMYREVYYDKWQRYVKYPIPAWVYSARAALVRTFSGVKEFIGAELQAEPWFSGTISAISWERQKQLMNAEIFEKNIQYARSAGFAKNYLWGVEWWYYAKTKQGDDSIWQAAKKIMVE